MNNNIVSFPNAKPSFPLELPTTMEEVKNNLENVRVMHATELAAMAMEVCLNMFHSAGFCGDDELSEQMGKEIALMIESMKAFLYKYHGIEHPLHKLIDELYENNDGIISYRVERIGE